MSSSHDWASPQFFNPHKLLAENAGLQLDVYVCYSRPKVSKSLSSLVACQLCPWAVKSEQAARTGCLDCPTCPAVQPSPLRHALGTGCPHRHPRGPAPWPRRLILGPFWVSQQTSWGSHPHEHLITEHKTCALGISKLQELCWGWSSIYWLTGSPMGREPRTPHDPSASGLNKTSGLTGLHNRFTTHSGPRVSGQCRLLMWGSS